jgi:hypothetical protein
MRTLKPIPNPLRDLTHQQRIVIGIGLGAGLAVATLATIAWASKSDPEPPKRAIEVADNCTRYTISSEQHLRDELRARVRSAAKKGAIDPLEVTSRYIRSITPRCKTYPARTDTPVEAKLFIDVYLQLLEVMQQDDLLSSTDYATWYSMATIWAAAQGVPAEDL